jgi:hypothetical protein
MPGAPRQVPRTASEWWMSRDIRSLKTSMMSKDDDDDAKKGGGTYRYCAARRIPTRPAPIRIAATWGKGLKQDRRVRQRQRERNIAIQIGLTVARFVRGRSPATTACLLNARHHQRIRSPIREHTPIPLRLFLWHRNIDVCCAHCTVEKFALP